MMSFDDQGEGGQVIYDFKGQTRGRGVNQAICTVEPFYLISIFSHSYTYETHKLEPILRIMRNHN